MMCRQWKRAMHRTNVTDRLIWGEALCLSAIRTSLKKKSSYCFNPQDWAMLSSLIRRLAARRILGGRQQAWTTTLHRPKIAVMRVTCRVMRSYANGKIQRLSISSGWRVARKIALPVAYLPLHERKPVRKRELLFMNPSEIRPRRRLRAVASARVSAINWRKGPKRM